MRAWGGDCFFASVTVNRLAALQLPWDRHRAQELSLPWRCALSFRHVTCVYKCACPWAQGRRNSSCLVVWKLQERSGLTPLPTPPGKRRESLPVWLSLLPTRPFPSTYHPQGTWAFHCLGILFLFGTNLTCGAALKRLLGDGTRGEIFLGPCVKDLSNLVRLLKLITWH